MKTLREGWLSYRDGVMPSNAGQTQRIETKRAFYAGAAHVFSLLAGDEVTERSDEQGVEFIQSIAEELEKFKEAGFR